MKIVLFQTIQFNISTQFKCKYSLIVKTFLFQAIQFSQAVLTRLLYYKPKLILRLCPNVSEHGKMFLNLFYNIILKFLKKALTVVSKKK